jgi:hypothetical protein
VRQLDGLQRSSPPSLARAAGRRHFTILPVAAEQTCGGALSGATRP